MKKFIIVVSSIFELVFYTFFMVLLGNIEIMNAGLDLLVHFLSLIVVAGAFYFLIRFLFHKLGMRSKKDIYYVVVVNLMLGLIAPILLIILIPNETLTNFAVLVLLSVVYYGFLINFIICLFNHFLTNRRKNL